MEQRISLITLGVADLRRAMDFYAGLGWQGCSPDDDVAFFQAGGMVFALWSRAKLAEDSATEDGGGWGGITLAPQRPLARRRSTRCSTQARAAGGTVARAGAATFWGGYSGVFHDPDGHAWEVAHNPCWTDARRRARRARRRLSAPLQRTAAGVRPPSATQLAREVRLVGVAGVERGPRRAASPRSSSASAVRKRATRANVFGP